MVSRLEYALLARATYEDNKKDIPKNWEVINTYESDTSDFAGTAYRNNITGDIVVAYRGTDSDWKNIQDWTQNNLTIAFNKIPNQFDDALRFYSEVAGANKDANVSITGHSLGGILAQLVGACSLKDTVTFNSIGVTHLLDRLNIQLDASLKYSNITNYSLANDILYFVHKKTGYQFLGQSYVVTPTNEGPVDAHSNVFATGYNPAYPADECLTQGSKPIYTQLNGIFNSAQEVTVPKDPLLIDIDGDGIETTSVENGVYFDQENDGFAEKSAWVGKDDGVLAYDKNNNGRIDDGNELFGDSYVKTDGTLATSGFDALSDLDSNGDGIINSEDTNFQSIKILKGDGTLLSLEEAGISTISLNSKNSVIRDGNGNRQLTSGTYTKTDGTTGKISDYELQSDPMNSIATEWIEVSEEIAALPDIPGMGKMHSLHQAMARDEELTALIKTFANASDANTRQSLITQIIYKWAGVEGIASDSRGSQMDAKDLTALEKFMGSDFLGVTNSGTPNSAAANLLKNAFAILRSYIYAELTSQTALKPLYEMLELQYDEVSQKYIYNLDTVQNYIDSVISQDTTSGKSLLLEFAGTFINLGLKETSNYTYFEQHYTEMGDDFKLLMQTVDKINIYGTEGDDTIDGTAQQEAVFGYGGNDTIYTRQGDDLVYGGDGDDVIDTCEGNDVIYGEAGNDTINSGAGDDIIYGGDGNDIITNSGGNDIIYGGSGDDTIKSTAKTTNKTHETLIGGIGNDYFEDKDNGDETFIFNQGDGNDIIYNRGGNDTIKFGEGINLFVSH